MNEYSDLILIIGGELPTTHLIDPIAARRSMKIANDFLPRLVKKERKLEKKLAWRNPGNSCYGLKAKPDMNVY